MTNKEAVKNLEIILDSLERRVARNILIPDAIQAIKMGIEAIEFCERRSIGLSGNIGERKCLGLGVNENEAYDMAIHALEAGKTLYEFVDKIQTTKQKSIPKCKMGENEWGTPIVCAATIDDVDQLMKSLDDFYKKRAEDMDIWIVCEMAKRWIESLKRGMDNEID